MRIALRIVRPDDLPIFFEHQCDAGAAAMVGFTPRTRAAFDAHWRTILGAARFPVLTIEVDGAAAGYVCTFPREDRIEIAYWLGREHWGRGIAGQAVARFLDRFATRPLFGVVAATNAASLALLHRAGFVTIAEETAPDGFREHLLRLDRGAGRPLASG